MAHVVHEAEVTPAGCVRGRGVAQACHERRDETVAATSTEAA